MGEVRDAAEQGRELMRRLVVLAGQESNRARSLSLNDLVVNAVSELDTPVELDLSADDATVQLDVWMAQRGASRRGSIHGETKAVTSIRVATRVVGSAVALTIEDDGASPSDKELRALFTPFTKLDRRPNVGLELTRLADLASRSGGYVTAGVREPHGLRIVLTLPVATSAGVRRRSRCALVEEGHVGPVRRSAPRRARAAPRRSRCRPGPAGGRARRAPRPRAGR